MLIALAGPSGSGKTTLANRLREYSNVQPLESYTTRLRRPSDPVGEQTFVSDREFDLLLAAGEFLWTVQPFKKQYRYGTRKKAVSTAFEDARHVYLAVLTVDTIPALYKYSVETFKLSRVRCIYLFIDDAAELRRRLSLDSSRTDTEERLAAMPDENAAAQKMRDVLHFVDAKADPEDVLVRTVRIINIP